MWDDKQIDAQVGGELRAGTGRVQWMQKLAKLTGEVVISVRGGEAVRDGRRKGGEEAMGCTGAGEKKNSELLLKLPL